MNPKPPTSDDTSAPRPRQAHTQHTAPADSVREARIAWPRATDARDWRIPTDPPPA